MMQAVIMNRFGGADVLYLAERPKPEPNTNGASEGMVGEFAGDRGKRLVLATKHTLTTRVGDPNSGGNHRKSMARSVESSLKRMNTDYINLLWTTRSQLTRHSII